MTNRLFQVTTTLNNNGEIAALSSIFTATSSDQALGMGVREAMAAAPGFTILTEPKVEDVTDSVRQWVADNPEDPAQLIAVDAIASRRGKRTPSKASETIIDHDAT